jgi:hypothetical protein
MRRLIQSKEDCESTLAITRFAANGVVELEFGRDSRRGKVLSSMAKY